MFLGIDFRMFLLLVHSKFQRIKPLLSLLTVCCNSHDVRCLSYLNRISAFWLSILESYVSAFGVLVTVIPSVHYVANRVPGLLRPKYGISSVQLQMRATSRDTLPYFTCEVLDSPLWKPMGFWWLATSSDLPPIMNQFVPAGNQTWSFRARKVTFVMFVLAVQPPYLRTAVPRSLFAPHQAKVTKSGLETNPIFNLQQLKCMIRVILIPTGGFTLSEDVVKFYAFWPL